MHLSSIESQTFHFSADFRLFRLHAVTGISHDKVVRLEKLFRILHVQVPAVPHPAHLPAGQRERGFGGLQP